MSERLLTQLIERIDGLVEDVGFIKGTMTGMEKQMAAQNGTVAELSKKVQRHEIIFGKIGVVVALVGAAMGLVAGIVGDWFKSRFNL